MSTSPYRTPVAGGSPGGIREICKRPGRHRNVVDNHRDMGAEIIEFINRWLYDVERMLASRLESLKDDLRSDDASLREQAAQEAAKIMDWLYPPSPPLSAEEQSNRVETAMADRSLSVKARLGAVRRAVRSTGRSKGRPRDETSQQAIRALALHYATTLSWREIALEIRGCTHKRPNPERSCNPCGSAVRNAATRLESFLKKMGYDPSFPLGKELDGISRLELLRLWKIDRIEPPPM